MYQKKLNGFKEVNMLNIFLKWSNYIVCTSRSAGGWVSSRIFKKVAYRISIFQREVAGKEGVFMQKNKLKSEILNKKKKL